MLEDCIEIGKNDIYDLSYNDFDRALVLDAKHKVKIWLCRPKPVARAELQHLIPLTFRIPGLYADSDIPDYTASANLQALTRTEDRQFGVEVIKHTANNIRDILPEIDQAGLITMKKNMRRPFFYHSARIQLPALLRSRGLIRPSDEAELTQVFKRHSDLWESGSYLIMLYTLKKERGLKISPAVLDQLADKFLELYEAESGLQQLGRKVDAMLSRS
ncbi:hypothetical protein D3C72_1452580 [compost metagenome]